MTKKKDKSKSKAENEAKAPGGYVASVIVSFKPTVNDPQGLTIRSALGSLGFSSVESVRSGKYFQVRLSASDRKDAGKQVDEMCSRLLANPVIETYSFEIAKA